MPMSPRLLRPLASGFNPRQIAGLGAWFDATDLSTLSQTSDGLTPVTANDNPVAYLKCKVTGTPLTQAVDANRPLWKAASSISGKPGLEFDGSNDYLFATSGGLMDVARNANGFTAFTVVQSADLNSRAFWHFAVGGASSYFRARLQLTYIAANGLRGGGRRLDGDLFEFAENTSFLASTPYVSTAVADYANAQATLQLNGGVPATDSPFLTSGNTSNTASSHVMLGGQFTNDAFTALSGLFSGTFCEWLVYRRALTAAESAKVEGYLAWKYGLQGQLPYNHPYARSFPGFGSQTLPTDPDAQTYLAAVSAADGTGVEVGVANAVDDFVRGCKSDGVWDAIKASCILAGARTLAGALTPLKGAAPTNNGPFVSGDYNRETGLVGNGTSKYLDTNRANNADPQNDNHNAVYVTTVGSSLALTSIENASFVGSNHIGLGGVNSRNDTAVIVSMQTGLNAHSRASSSAFQHRVGGVSQTHNSNSQTPTSGNLTLLRTSSLYGSHRIAFYSIGESLDLALLDTRVTALITAIGAAIP